MPVALTELNEQHHWQQGTLKAFQTGSVNMHVRTATQELRNLN
jgi:hypothetical protein